MRRVSTDKFNELIISYLMESSPLNVYSRDTVIQYKVKKKILDTLLAYLSDYVYRKEFCVEEIDGNYSYVYLINYCSNDLFRNVLDDIDSFVYNDLGWRDSDFSYQFQFVLPRIDFFNNKQINSVNITFIIECEEFSSYLSEGMPLDGSAMSQYYRMEKWFIFVIKEAKHHELLNNNELNSFIEYFLDNNRFSSEDSELLSTIFTYKEFLFNNLKNKNEILPFLL